MDKLNEKRTELNQNEEPSLLDDVFDFGEDDVVFFEEQETPSEQTDTNEDCEKKSEQQEVSPNQANNPEKEDIDSLFAMDIDYVQSKSEIDITKANFRKYMDKPIAHPWEKNAENTNIDKFISTLKRYNNVQRNPDPRMNLCNQVKKKLLDNGEYRIKANENMVLSKTNPANQHKKNGTKIQKNNSRKEMPFAHGNMLFKDFQRYKKTEKMIDDRDEPQSKNKPTHRNEINKEIDKKDGPKKDSSIILNNMPFNKVKPIMGIKFVADGDNKPIYESSMKTGNTNTRDIRKQIPTFYRENVLNALLSKNNKNSWMTSSIKVQEKNTSKPLNRSLMANRVDSSPNASMESTPSMLVKSPKYPMIHSFNKLRSKELNNHSVYSQPNILKETPNISIVSNVKKQLNQFKKEKDDYLFEMTQNGNKKNLFEESDKRKKKDMSLKI